MLFFNRTKKDDPKFLLPNSINRYYQLLDEAKKRRKILEKKLKAEKKRRTVALKSKVETITSEDKFENDAARELARRKVKKLQTGTHDLNPSRIDDLLQLLQATTFIFPETFGKNGNWLIEGPLIETTTWAENITRTEEQKKILELGKILHSKENSLKARGFTIKAVATNAKAWDKEERLLIQFNNRFFIVNLHTEAQITGKIRKDDKGFILSGTTSLGKISKQFHELAIQYSKPQIKWMNDSLQQMTEQELEIIANNS